MLEFIQKVFVVMQGSNRLVLEDWGLKNFWKEFSIKMSWIVRVAEMENLQNNKLVCVHCILQQIEQKIQN